MVAVEHRVALKIDCWTRRRLNTRSVGADLLDALSEILPTAFPTKWGEIEPFEVSASLENIEPAVNCFADPQFNVLMGMTDSEASIMLVNRLLGPARAPFRISFTIDSRDADFRTETGLQSVAQLFELWSTVVNADFSRCCLKNERLAKNVIERFLDDDGFITSPKVFDASILEGLPGVYWLTYFGKDLVNWLGSDVLRSAPWPTIRPVGEAYILQRSATPMTWQEDLRLDQALIEHIGTQRFFDIHFPDRPIETLRLIVPYARKEKVDA